MPGANLGPELEDVDGDLTNPGAETDLDKATAALSNLTAAVEDLKARLDKGEEASTTEVEQAAADAEAAADALSDKDKTAAALKSISDKAAELAKGTELEGDALKNKVTELVEALQALTAVEDKPAKGEVDTEKDEGALSKVLATIAESALSLAGRLDNNGVVSTEDMSSIDEVMDGIAKVATELAVEKLEEGIEISPLFDDQELGAVAKGMASVLRDVAKSAATLSPLVEGELGDGSKQELGRVMGLMHLAKAKVAKSDAKESSFESTLREVAERALFLARKADRSEDEAVKKEAGQLRDLMQGLIEKYAAKTDGFDFADYSIVIDVDKKLNGIEAAVVKADEPAEGDKPDETKPDEAAAAEGDKSKEGEETDAAKGETAVTKAMKEIEGLTSRVAELKAIIAKARDTAASPAGGSEPEGEGVEDDGPLFPMDFNDPVPDLDDDEE